MTPMEPVAVHVRLMDSQAEPKPAVLQARSVPFAERVLRGLKRLGLVSGIGLVVLVLPVLHLCGAVVALVVGPVAAFLAFRGTAVLQAGTVECPRCAAQAAIEDGTTGWPARLHCLHCGSTFDAWPRS